MKKRRHITVGGLQGGLPAFGQQMRAFVRGNQRLLWLVTLLMAGVALGCVVYARLPETQRTALSAVLALTPVQPEAEAIGRAVLSALLLPLVLLVVLFLIGLTPYGVPPILLVPLFLGAGIGLAEAQYFSLGSEGLKVVLLMVLPQVLLSVMAVLVGGAEALRMSCLVSRQLLPSSAHCGGLWIDFKLYCARFLIALGLAMGSAAVNVIARLLFI